MLFMKGPACDPEIAQAAETHAGRFRRIADHAYAIPGTPHARRLVVYERLEDRAAPAPKLLAPGYPGPIREVASAANPTFKLARDVLTGRGLRKHGQALLAGPRPIAEVLARFPDRAAAWLTDLDGP